MNESDLHVFPKVAPKFTEIRDFYTLEERPCGKGQYSSVFRAVGLPKSPAEGDEVAVKVTKKQKIGIEHAVRKEMDALKAAPHSNVIKFIEVREDEMQFYTVMEFATGDDLFERVSRGDVFSDQRASTIVRSLLFALKGLHEKKWIHRDVKPGNIMFAGKGASAPVKLVDFGSAEQWKQDDDINKKVGTPKYMPPEMFEKKDYKSEVDMWSLGVVAFILLTGQEPFVGQGPALAKAICEGRWAWPAGASISAHARDFVKSLLVVRQTARPSAADALKHPWVARPKDAWKLPDLRQPAQRAGIRGLKRLPAKQRWRTAGHVVRAALRLLCCATPQTGSGQSMPRQPGRGKRQASGRPLCNGCDRPIDDLDQGLDAMDGYWHAVCFNCGMCGEPLEEQYVEADGWPCHRLCVERGLSVRPPAPPAQAVEMCPKCGKRVMNGIDWAGELYHERCFTCHQCQLPITDGNLESVGDTPFHRRCLEHIKAQPGGHRVALMQERLDTGSRSGAPSSSRGKTPTEGLSHAGQNAGGTKTMPRPGTGAWAPPGQQQTSIPQHHGQSRPEVLDIGTGLMVGTPAAALRSGQSPTARQPPSPPPQPVGSCPPRSPQPVGSGARAAAACRSSAGESGTTPSRTPPPASPGASNFCHECGHPHPVATAKFCMNCGTKRL